MDFPYVGAGVAFVFEWAYLSVVFEREPTPKEKKDLIAMRPKPFSDYAWDGRVLELSSDYGVQLAIVKAYRSSRPEDGGENLGDEVSEVTDLAKEWDFAAFSADTERFLHTAHNILPIQLAYREEDEEAGGTELSSWHQESCDFLGRHIQQWDEEKAAEVLTPALRVLASALRDMEKILPPKNWHTSGWLEENRHWFVPLTWYYEWAREVEHKGWGQPLATFRKLMTAGQVQEAWAFCQDNMEVGLDLCSELNTLFRAEYCGPRRVLAFLELVEPAAGMERWLGRVALKAWLQPEVCSDVEENVIEGLFQKWRDHLFSEQAADWLAGLFWELLQDKEWQQARKLAWHMVPYRFCDPTVYGNALYVAQTDNTGIPVDRDFDLYVLEHCLPHGEANPTVYVNAACVYVELGDVDGAAAMMEKAVAQGRVASILGFRTEPLFAHLREDPRLAEIWDRLEKLA